MKLRRLIVALSLCPLASSIIVLGQAGAQGANQTLDQPSESARPRITFEEYVTPSPAFEPCSGYREIQC